MAGEDARLEVAGSVEWENVSFSYFANGLESHSPVPAAAVNGTNGTGDAQHWALRGIDVKVPAGGKLAIVGRTGAGKSTMVKLLARLIEPTSGRVLLDGRDIRELPLTALRKTVGHGAAGADALFRHDRAQHCLRQHRHAAAGNRAATRASRASTATSR